MWRCKNPPSARNLCRRCQYYKVWAWNMSAMECNPLITLLGESNGLEGHSFGISAGIRIHGFEFLLQKTGCFVEDRLHQQHLSTQFGKKNIGWIDNFCVVVQVLGLGYKGKHVWFMDAVHMFWIADWFRVESTKVEIVTGNVWSMHQCNGLTWQISGHYPSWN